MTAMDEQAIAQRISAGKTDDLVDLLSDAAVVESLSVDHQLALARHRSVDVPRSLARHAAVLHAETQRELAKSTIFTARRELVKNGGAALPPDLLDALAEDEDGAVRKLVREARGENEPTKSATKKRTRRHAGEGFAAKPRADLLKFLDDDDAVAALDAVSQVQLARHRSVEVPRALARHSAALSDEARSALAESPIFTARRDLLHNAGELLPEDVLATLSEDSDSVVRALVSRIWTPDEDNLPEAIRVRRAELAAKIDGIRASTEMDDGDVDRVLRTRDERLLAALADNTDVVTSMSPDRQVALAKHRSISVPRTLARQSAILSDEAIRELAQSPVFTARRGLARYGLGRLDDDLLKLLSKDEDDVVRKLVSDRVATDSGARTSIAGRGEDELLQHAESGNAEAMSELGLLAWTRGDVGQASQWLERAANLGEVLAMLDLESMALERGDDLMAGHWLEKAAEVGHAGAVFRYQEVPKPDPDYAGMDLRDLDFSGQDLSRANFRNANLADADLSNSTLTRANFTGANLTGTNLTGAILNAADFTHANARGADFTNANAARALFRYTVLTDAVFREASIRDADFMGSSLDDVDLAGADADGALQFNANWDVELSNGNFTNRVMMDRDFADIPVRGGIFRHATLDGSSFVGLDLSGASFINASLIGVDYTNAELAGADFSGAVLVNADFSGAHLNGADFRTAVLTAAEFIESRRDGDQAEALLMINELDELTGGDGDDGYRKRADQIEEFLVTADRYAEVADADFRSAQIGEAHMPQRWLSDNGGERVAGT